MSISIEAKEILARVKDYRGYTDMIFDLTVHLECTDTETGSKIGYQIFKEFDTEFNYTPRKNKFVPFDEITEEQITSMVDTLIAEERVGGQITITEWAEKRFADIYAQPVYKPFTFQIPSEPVGVGTSPVL